MFLNDADCLNAHLHVRSTSLPTADIAIELDL